MPRLLAATIGMFLLVCHGFSQQFPKLPKVMPGVVNIPHLMQQPTKTVKPVYPPEALQRWVQGTIVLDAVLDTKGDVEIVGCDAYCSDARPDMVQAAGDAVRQWHWNPILIKGMPARVRTRVPVEFALDETSPPISICNVLGDPKWFNGRVVNVFGTAEREADLHVLRSDQCPGSMVIGMNGDATPVIQDAKYAAFEQAMITGPTPVTLRGLIHEIQGTGRLGGERLVLQRVLRCSPK